MKKFLGAKYDDKTATYRFDDGSAVYPVEMRHDFEAALSYGKMIGYPVIALLVLWSWKDRLKELKK